MLVTESTEPQSRFDLNNWIPRYLSLGLTAGPTGTSSPASTWVLGPLLAPQVLAAWFSAHLGTTLTWHTPGSRLHSNQHSFLHACQYSAHWAEPAFWLQRCLYSMSNTYLLAVPMHVASHSKLSLPTLTLGSIPLDEQVLPYKHLALSLGCHRQPSSFLLARHRLPPLGLSQLLDNPLLGLPSGDLLPSWYPPWSGY
jgi:hypothetical protein